MADITSYVDDLWYYSKDHCDNPGSSQAQRLQQSIRQLLNDAKARKDSDYIYQHLRDVESQVQSLKNNEGIYSHHDIDEMHDRCQDLKRMLRS